jgi:hypothetical protein
MAINKAACAGACPRAEPLTVVSHGASAPRMLCPDSRAFERHRMRKRFPLHPMHPERVCWGCDRYCAADSMQCGNGSVRTPHPAELFGDDWAEWSGVLPSPAEPSPATADD